MKYTLIILLLSMACSSKTIRDQKEKQENDKKEEPTLKNWSRELVMALEERDQRYTDDHENFIAPYFSVEYSENEIIATTLMENSCMDSIVGQIDVSNDTLFLKSYVALTDGTYCPEYHKHTFVISNPSNKRYTVISEKF